MTTLTALFGEILTGHEAYWLVNDQPPQTAPLMWVGVDYFINIDARDCRLNIEPGVVRITDVERDDVYGKGATRAEATFLYRVSRHIHGLHVETGALTRRLAEIASPVEWRLPDE